MNNLVDEFKAFVLITNYLRTVREGFDHTNSFYIASLCQQTHLPSSFGLEPMHFSLHFNAFLGWVGPLINPSFWCLWF